ncbi:S8 family serine peptidase, partial [Paenibacillus sp. TAF58]
MERQVHVIPFQVLEKIEQVNEIPTGVEMIQAPKIWDQTKGKGITVAILDTGCDLTHPDLRERIIGGINFTNDDGGKTDIYMDYNGHGTHVAGTIAATKNNNG